MKNGPLIYQDLWWNYTGQMEWYGTRINQKKKVKSMVKNLYNVLNIIWMAVEISGKRMNYSLNNPGVIG